MLTESEKESIMSNAYLVIILDDEFFLDPKCQDQMDYWQTTKKPVVVVKQADYPLNKLPIGILQLVDATFDYYDDRRPALRNMLAYVQEQSQSTSRVRFVDGQTNKEI